MNIFTIRGLYMGSTDPFVAGVIENNLVMNTIGYKNADQIPTAASNGSGNACRPNSTIIHNNTFVKNDRPSPDGDRPNLLVGGFPDSGPGSDGLYQIYGNLFDHNPREALLQASGRVTIHGIRPGTLPTANLANGRNAQSVLPALPRRIPPDRCNGCYGNL
jgi:hypothetical protein